MDTTPEQLRVQALADVKTQVLSTQDYADYAPIVDDLHRALARMSTTALRVNAPLPLSHPHTVNMRHRSYT